MTAQPNGDYVDVNKRVTFTSLEASITEQITIIDDVIPEIDEEFIVEIVRHNSETNVDTKLDLCRITIVDDDCKSPLNRI